MTALIACGLAREARIVAGAGVVAIAGGEKTVAAWLQQLQDQFNRGLRTGTRCEYFVRDYGLLFCAPADAPAGAVPLSTVK